MKKFCFSYLIKTVVLIFGYFLFVGNSNMMWYLIFLFCKYAFILVKLFCLVVVVLGFPLDFFTGKVVSCLKSIMNSVISFIWAAMKKLCYVVGKKWENMKVSLYLYISSSSKSLSKSVSVVFWGGIECSSAKDLWEGLNSYSKKCQHGFYL